MNGAPPSYRAVPTSGNCPPRPASKPAAEFGQSVASLLPRLARFVAVYQADGNYTLLDDPELADLVSRAPVFAGVLYESLLDRSGNIVTLLLAMAAHEKKPVLELPTSKVSQGPEKPSPWPLSPCLLA